MTASLKITLPITDAVWAALGRIRAADTAPVVTPPPPPPPPPSPPPPPLSPDGSTLVAGSAGSLTTAEGVWTYAGTNNAALNGTTIIVPNGTVSLLVANSGKMYVQNADHNWYLWSAGSAVGLPAGTTPGSAPPPSPPAPPSPPPAPPPSPPPAPGPSLIAAGTPVMRFQGTDDGRFSNQAYLDVSPTDVGPLSFAIFAKAESDSFGCPIGWGNVARESGLIAMGWGGSQRGLGTAQWDNMGIPTGAPWCSTSGTPPQSIQLGVWHHEALLLDTSPRSNRVVLNGEMGADGFTTSTPLTDAQKPPLPFAPPWPVAPTRVSFGSLYKTVKDNNPPVYGGADAHSMAGCLSNGVMVAGIMTQAEIVRHMHGESPVSIWGARVLGWWKFDRLVNGQVPNEIAGGGALSLADSGTAAGHMLPQIVTN